MNLENRISPEQACSIVETLARFDPAVIYLFGSFGSPSQHPGSDIDIAFLSSSPADPLDCFHAAGELASPLGRSVDLIDLTLSSTVMAKEVIRTGIPLFIGDPRAHQEFEMHVLADYARLNEERRAILAS